MHRPFTMLLLLLTMQACNRNEPEALAIQAVGHDSRIDLRWKQSDEDGLVGYFVYRSAKEDGPFLKLHSEPHETNIYSDFIGENGKTFYYRVGKILRGSPEPQSLSETVFASTVKMSDDQLLTSVQEATFRYFYNPEGHKGYSDVCWGLTASDVPDGYRANSPGRDDGTIAPTAAISSMPYTPAASLAAMKHLYHTYGDRLWGEYGFRDAFNLDRNWFADSYIAIDQGPIICMIENHRTALCWRMFMSNPEIAPMLQSIGWIRSVESQDPSRTDE